MPSSLPFHLSPTMLLLPFTFTLLCVSPWCLLCLAVPLAVPPAMPLAVLPAMLPTMPLAVPLAVPLAALPHMLNYYAAGLFCGCWICCAAKFMAAVPYAMLFSVLFTLPFSVLQPKNLISISDNLKKIGGMIWGLFSLHLPFIRNQMEYWWWTGALYLKCGDCSDQCQVDMTTLPTSLEYQCNHLSKCTRIKSMKWNEI